MCTKGPLNISGWSGGGQALNQCLLNNLSRLSRLFINKIIKDSRAISLSPQCFLCKRICDQHLNSFSRDDLSRYTCTEVAEALGKMGNIRSQVSTLRGNELQRPPITLDNGEIYQNEAAAAAVPTLINFPLRVRERERRRARLRMEKRKEKNGIKRKYMQTKLCVFPNMATQVGICYSESNRFQNASCALRFETLLNLQIRQPSPARGPRPNRPPLCQLHH